MRHDSARAVAAGLLCGMLAGCASLPKARSAKPSHALTDTGGTRLGRITATTMAGLGGAPSGIHLLPRGPEAFLARLALVEATERSLDLQYYIWQSDTVGKLLMAAVLRAAERGVRVRILIDDIGSMASDDALLAIEAQPNIEVRLYNPASSRTFRSLWLLTDFSRVNRRMHNKSFTADNRMTIVGGRNIGDEYFEASATLDYGDVDALVVGAAVSAASASFDHYWNSESAFGIRELRDERPTPDERAQVVAALEAVTQTERAQEYAQAMRDSPLGRDLQAGTVAFAPATISVLADDSLRTTQPGRDGSTRLLAQLRPEFDAVQDRLILVSPYFVPRAGGLRVLDGIRRRGVRVTILTNGLASTDEPPVFAKYRKYRRPLLKLGVDLHEVNPSTNGGPTDRTVTAAEKAAHPPRVGLHGKLFVFDCRNFFIGSMNLDPRSAEINTEVGLLVTAPEVATELCAGLDRIIARHAYRLAWRAAADGDTGLEWTAGNGTETRFTTEPETSWWRRFTAWFYALLPIESLMSTSPRTDRGHVPQ